MSIDQRPVAISLMGPTASGKTDAALALAGRWPVKLISVDSALVYRGMDIGSAKPDAEVLQRFPHGLIDIRDPWQSYSAAEFRDDALRLMNEASDQRRIPVLVGGTGLYFRALWRGLSALPSADAGLRAELVEEAQTKGWAALHEELAARDPQAAARIHRNDPQRIQRALEVMRLTGETLSARQQCSGTRPPWRVLSLALVPTDREWLHRRVAERLELMLEAGFLDEVRELMAHPSIHADLPAMRAVGYRQAWMFLQGRIDRGGFYRQAEAATRQLAKRQLTWLRRELAAIGVACDRPDLLPRLIDRIGRHIGSADRSFLQ